MRLVLKIASGLGIVFGLVVVLALLATGWLAFDARHSRASDATYVALGSSFAAGPGIGDRARDAPRLCFQSNGNFAHLLARKRGLRLLDRSCSGSTTADILTRGQLFQTPQIVSVTNKTLLVTVTTGGNDLGYVGGLMFTSCQTRPDPVPWWLRSACRSSPRAESAAELASLSESLDTIAREVRRRAPDATLVFIDYATILPEDGECFDRMPLSPPQLSRYRRLARDLAATTHQAAERNGALLIRASDLTRGHDVCARDPWVAGWTFPKALFGPGPMAYHPNAKAMTAITLALDAALPAS
jgi:hypothetical protein